MKILLVILLSICILPGFAQEPKDAQFTIKSSKDVKNFDGVFMTIHVKEKDRPTDNHTVAYHLRDHEDKPILLLASDKNGVIRFTVNNFKYIKSVYIGGPGDIITKIDLTQFKGKNAVLESDLLPDLRPLH